MCILNSAFCIHKRHILSYGGILEIFRFILSVPERRARLTLFLGFLFNILFAAFKIITGIIYGSVWLFTVAFYYIMLCSVKYLMIKTDLRVKAHPEREGIREWQRRSFKRVGRLLLVLNSFAALTVFTVLFFGKRADYSGFVLIVFSVYTLVRTAVSLLNVRKLQGIEDPLVRGSKYLGISVTLMSVFTLLTALIGRLQDIFAAAFLRISGIGIAAALITAALMMLRSFERG